MDKLKLNLKTALVILLGYAAHKSNPQYTFPTAESQVSIAQAALGERSYYYFGTDAQVNGLEAFTHWAQAYQQRPAI